jgi:signal transduction histidine kinase
VSERPSLRLGFKLGAVLFAVVALPLAIVYLALLPRLEARLVDAKIDELERAAPAVSRDIQRTDRYRYGETVIFYASSLNARVVVYERLDGTTLLPLADSSGIRSRDVQEDPIALAAASSSTPASGRVQRGETELAEVAWPLGQGTVVLLSAPLRDALANVELVRRTLLLSGAVALVVSWLAGYLAASRLTRRVRRLEAAAGKIAAGEFDEPVVDTGRDELGELARSFDAMRVRLADLDHARREFIANASHELRTPVFSLGGFLELLTDEDLDEATRDEFLAEMRAQVERLAKLATDLLDLSRMDAGQLSVDVRELDLSAAARTLAEEFRALPSARDHELRLAADRPTPALGDEQRVLQIGRILVENAFRHTPAGTVVEVRAGERNGEAVLTVHDDGPGVPADIREHVFERFYRGDGSTAFGSGLGLAIGSQLATMMGGSIEIESTRGDTTFTLVLPRSEGISREIDEPEAVAAGSGA